MISEILENAKMLLGLTDGSEDDVISFYIDDITEAVMSYCRLDFLPRQLYGLTAQIAAEMFLCRGHLDIVSLTEGERRVEFKNAARSILAGYGDRLKPFVKTAGRLPSEVTLNA